MFFFLNPVFVFFFTLTSYFIIYMLWQLYDSNLPIIKEHTILYIFIVLNLWIIGSFIGRFISLKLKKFFSVKSLFTEKTSIRLTFIIPLFYFFFKISDIFLITDYFSLHYTNIALYRKILISGISTISDMLFFSIFNNLFFFFPCIIFYYLRKKKITFFQSYILIFYFIFFVYLSASRSTLFLSFTIFFFFLAFAKISIKKVILIPLTLIFSFFFFGTLLVGEYSDFTMILNYIVLPIIAFDRILENPQIVSSEYLLILRFLESILIKFNLSSSIIEQLDYVFFENGSYTNVYSNFGVYFLSFGLVGSIIFIFFISIITSFFVNSALRFKSIRLTIFSCYLLAFIPMGLFYDYIFNFFFLVLPLNLWIFLPKSKLNF